MALEDPQALILAGVAILAAIYVVRWKVHPLSSIPAVGGSAAPGLSILTALNFMRNGRDVLQEGYDKYHGSTFKVALLDQWLVVVCGPKMVDELKTRPDDDLSFAEGIEETIQMRYTVGHEAFDDPYHVDIIKEKLTRTLPVTFPDLMDEMKLAVKHYIPTKDDEWTAITLMATMQQIVARASNRVFVGAPVCRNPEYLNLIVGFTHDVIKDRVVMSFTPYFLKTFIGNLVSKTKKSIRQVMLHLRPMIDERKANMKELGEDWSDKPVDLLQWVIDEAVRKNNPDTSIVERVLLVNFAAIHTSSTAITQALFDLASMPEYIQPLREEIESVISTDGWTKAAMGKMWKLDSLFRESARYHVGLTTITRKAMKDITFNDGTFIPKGTIVVAAAHPTHRDDSNYVDPEVFDPFRFSKLREGEGAGTKHQFVNPSIEYVSFGLGKHACPGRFFAANELKAMLGYILLNYDLKLGGDGKRPANMYFGANVIPSMTGQVLFRKRQAASS